MRKKFKLSFLILIIGIAPFLMADGNSGGGGGGGGKGNGKNGGASTDTGAWRKGYLTPDWTYAYTPVPTNCGCPNSGGASGQGQCYPMARSVNSYPNINNQNSTSSSEYYSRITVTNLGVVPGWAPSSKTFAGKPRGPIDIQIPHNQPYSIEFEYLDGCSNCMSPGMVNLPPFVGRRIYWYSNSNYNINNTNPITYPSWFFPQPLRLCN